MTLLYAMLAASAVGFAEPAQGVQDPGPPRGGALLMLGYEAIKTGKPGPDASFVARLNAALKRNPSARSTFDLLLAKWKKVPNKTQLLGRKFGGATLGTRFSESELRSAFSAAPGQPQPALEPVSELPDPSTFVFQSDPAKMNREGTKREATAGPTLRANARIVAQRPHVPRTLFKMESTGLYCVNEGTDWGIHSEPYVIFVMWKQAAREYWTVRIGPATMDSGENFVSTTLLLGMTGASQPVSVFPIVLENDGWDPDQVQDFVQAYLDVAMPHLPNAYAVRSALNAAIWQFRAISAAVDDDLIGIGQFTLTLPQATGLSAIQHTAPGGQKYDLAWIFNGGSSGAYYVLVNVSRV